MEEIKKSRPVDQKQNEAPETKPESEYSLYLYEPAGAEARTVNERFFTYTNSLGNIKKFGIVRGVNIIPTKIWNDIKKSNYAIELINSNQLKLVSNSDNLITGYIKSLESVEALINKCWDGSDNGCLVRWRSFIQSQNFDTNAKYSIYLSLINKRLELLENPNVIPRPSREPLDPILAATFN